MWRFVMWFLAILGCCAGMAGDPLHGIMLLLLALVVKDSRE